MTLGNGEDHRVLDGARVKLRRAYEVADIFEYRKVNVLGSESFKALLGHACVQVAHAAGVQLDDLRAGLGDRVRVNIGVYIRFHYADAHFVLQGRNSCLERGSLARAGGRHEVEEECFFLFQLLSELIRFPVVIFKYAFFDLQYSEAFHNSCTSLYFSLVNSLSYLGHCRSFCCLPNTLRWPLS